MSVFVRLLGLIVFSGALASCGTVKSLLPSNTTQPAAAAATSDADTAAYLNKTMQLDRPMYLIQTKMLNPTGYSGYWLFNFPATTYYNNYIQANIPSIQDYQAHPETWQSFQGTPIISNQARVVGIVNAGTPFHISNISANGYAKGYWVTVQIDGGAYKGDSAMFANPKSIVPGLYH